MEKIDRYDVEVYVETESYEPYAKYELCKFKLGDVVLYDDHERIVEEMQRQLNSFIRMVNDLESRVEDLEGDLSYARNN